MRERIMILAANHQQARFIARHNGLKDGEWRYVHGEDSIRGLGPGTEFWFYCRWWEGYRGFTNVQDETGEVVDCIFETTQIENYIKTLQAIHGNKIVVKHVGEPNAGSS